MGSNGTQDGAADGANDGGLERTEIHDVLRNDRRRLVLRRLRDNGGSETVRSLAEYIAGVESDESPPPRNVRQSVYVSLHQTHLPKLDELGIVTYDANAKEVSLDEHADEVTVYLEVVPKYGLSWGEYYLGLGLLGLIAIGAAAAGIPPFAGIGAELVSGAFHLLIVCSALYHIRRQGGLARWRASGG